MVLAGTGFSTTVVQAARSMATASSGVRMISFFIVEVVSFHYDSLQVPRPDVFRQKIFCIWRHACARPPESSDAGNRAKAATLKPPAVPTPSGIDLPHSATPDRNFFVRDRRRFDSRMRSFNPRGRGECWRRRFSRSARTAARSSRSFLSSNSRSRSLASFRLVACDRESCTVTLIPDGRCRRVTAVETLFTFCPPGPPERAKVSCRSDSGNSITPPPA